MLFQWLSSFDIFLWMALAHPSETSMKPNLDLEYDKSLGAVFTSGKISTKSIDSSFFRARNLNQLLATPFNHLQSYHSIPIFMSLLSFSIISHPNFHMNPMFSYVFHMFPRFFLWTSPWSIAPGKPWRWLWTASRPPARPSGEALSSD